MADPIEIARRYVNEKFPDATTAFVGGSALLSSWDASHSDIDIVVIDPAHSPQAIADRFESIPIETFIAKLTDIEQWWMKDIQRGRSIILRICAQGAVLINDNEGAVIAKQAKELFVKGPKPLSQNDIDFVRYRISNFLDDLETDISTNERIFVAMEILSELTDLVLLSNGLWSSSGKWKYRRLLDFDPDLAADLSEAFQNITQKDDVDQFIKVVDYTLSSHGGRLMSGFIRDKDLT